MGNKKSFNLIAFGGRPIFWQPDFVPVNEDTLQSAWTWILGYGWLVSKLDGPYVYAWYDLLIQMVGRAIT